MCGLCGVLNADDHWTDAAGSAAFADRVNQPTRRRERLHRVRLANRVLKYYGFTLGDAQGTAYLLSSRTGRQELVGHVAALWPVAERMAKRPCDPLDPALLAALDHASPALDHG